MSTGESQPVPIQMGLFGGFNAVADMHTVAAHTRIQADGSEVFVGEHIRWNRGRTTRHPSAPRPRNESVPEGQLSLWK